MNVAWRFHHNGYGQGVGLNEGGVETFKDNPDASLAREICQNSIDARVEGKPALVEFKTFIINRQNIFGVDELTEQITNCYEFRKGKQPEEKQLKSMLDCIMQEEITCLRISDFNTTGLLGVANDEIDKPFYNLTKGSGTSDKIGSTGGSKGIGKFASFEASLTNTVFYSTKTIDGETGGIGISKLRSAPYEKDNQRLLTQGIGYYGIGDTNAPIHEEFILDPTFKRSEHQYGTDLFIIGYNNSDDWKEIITCEILDSFMIAILEEKLNVVVDDIVIDKNTISNIIYSTDILDVINLKLKKSIKSQYELYIGDEQAGVSVKEFEIEQGSFKVFVKQYNSNNEKDASKQCIKVRYPYMKIMYDTGYSYLPYSAMIVIGDNEINQRLREIENPQHTGWFIKRLNNYPEEKKITKAMMKTMDGIIREFIQDVLSSNVGEQTDVEGAGDFLPSFEDEGMVNNMIITSETMDVSSVKKVNITQPKSDKIGEEAESNVFGKAEIDLEDDGDYTEPHDTDTPPNPNPNLEHEPNEGGYGAEDGNEALLKKVLLSGMRYRNIAIDSKSGKYDIIFESTHNEKDCELEIKQVGESGDKYHLNIIRAKINGRDCTVEDGIIKHFEIRKGKKYKISYVVEIDEMFAGEVNLNAYR